MEYRYRSFSEMLTLIVEGKLNYISQFLLYYPPNTRELQIIKRNNIICSFGYSSAA